MFEYMRARENYKPINGKYLEKQADVNEKMRQVLIDWMVEVNSRKFHLQFICITKCVKMIG
jgi:hypothetical protein